MEPGSIEEGAYCEVVDAATPEGAERLVRALMLEAEPETNPVNYDLLDVTRVTDQERVLWLISQVRSHVDSLEKELSYGE